MTPVCWFVVWMTVCRQQLSCGGCAKAYVCMPQTAELWCHGSSTGARRGLMNQTCRPQPGAAHATATCHVAVLTGGITTRQLLSLHLFLPLLSWLDLAGMTSGLTRVRHHVAWLVLCSRTRCVVYSHMINTAWAGTVAPLVVRPRTLKYKSAGRHPHQAGCWQGHAELLCEDACRAKVLLLVDGQRSPNM